MKMVTRMIQPAMTPGRIIGINTRRNVARKPAPQTIEASSNSLCTWMIVLVTALQAVGQKAGNVGDQNDPDGGIDRNRKIDVSPQQSQRHRRAGKRPGDENQTFDEAAPGDFGSDRNVSG